MRQQHNDDNRKALERMRGGGGVSRGKGKYTFNKIEK